MVFVQGLQRLAIVEGREIDSNKNGQENGSVK